MFEYFSQSGHQSNVVLMPKTSKDLNIGKVCSLYNLVSGAENILKSYSLEEGTYASQLKTRTREGRALLDQFQISLKDHSSEFNIEINEEFVPLKEDKSCLPYLSIGTPANDANDRVFVQFICKILDEYMGLNVRLPNFFVFYLPPQLYAITEEGFHIDSVGGFTNIKKENRVEFNIYPNRDLENILSNITHEIIHCAVLEDPSLKHSETLVESLTQDFVNYLPLMNYQLRRMELLGSLDELIKEKYNTLLEVDKYISDHFEEEIRKCIDIIVFLQQFGEKIKNEELHLIIKK